MIQRRAPRHLLIGGLFAASLLLSKIGQESSYWITYYQSRMHGIYPNALSPEFGREMTG